MFWGMYVFQNLAIAAKWLFIIAFWESQHESIENFLFFVWFIRDV